MKATITVVGDRDDTTARHEEERNIQVHYKNCAPFTDCMSEKNNKQVDNTKDLRVVVPMYDLREYSNSYFTKSGSLWEYFRDRPNATIRDSGWFKSKARITGRTPCANNTKNVVITVPLKDLSNFWRTLEISSIYNWKDWGKDLKIKEPNLLIY